MSGGRAAAIVMILALASSITGLWNGFAYDDVAIILKDQRIHALRDVLNVFTQPYWPPMSEHVGSLYRPFTSLGFALQWIVGGGSPLIFHITSIALYVAVCMVVFRLARQLFDEKAALIAGAIFAVHPLHVEAVANIVGQAELAAALLMSLGVSLYIDWRREGALGGRRAGLLCTMYGAAMLFKEHAVVMPALILAVELLPSPLGNNARRRAMQLLPVMVGMAVVGVAFVAVRTHFVGKITSGGFEASIFVGQSFPSRFLTMLNVIVEWIRLFIWPATLSADYSPSRINPATEFSPTMLPSVAVILAVITLGVWARKKYPSATFSLAWVVTTLLIPSNLIVVTGFVLAERALFSPSVGVSLLLGAVIAGALRRASQPAMRLATAAVAIAIVAGVARSATRNPVWKNNDALFRQTVEDAPTSWKAHEMLGELLVTQGKGEGILELNVGVRLGPAGDPLPAYLAAHRLDLVGRHEWAIPLYLKVITLVPANAGVRAEAAYCLAKTGRMKEAREIASRGLELSPGDVRLIGFMRYADSTALANVAIARHVD